MIRSIKIFKRLVLTGLFFVFTGVEPHIPDKAQYKKNHSKALFEGNHLNKEFDHLNDKPIINIVPAVF